MRDSVEQHHLVTESGVEGLNLLEDLTRQHFAVSFKLLVAPSQSGTQVWQRGTGSRLLLSEERTQLTRGALRSQRPAMA
jgi:hypothetical protein